MLSMLSLETKQQNMALEQHQYNYNKGFIKIKILDLMTTKTNKRLFMDEKSSKKSIETQSTDGSLSPQGSPCSKFEYKQKSQLCKKFMQKGYCPYGDRCKFAHGCFQLRQNNLQNCKYKTKQCTAFHNTLYCRYGQRCNFIHSYEQKQTQIVHKRADFLVFIDHYPEILKHIYGNTGNCSRLIDQNGK